MQAKYAGSGDKYEALIASIDGNTITVNWFDNDPNHRHVDAGDVFKDGAPCLFVTGEADASQCAFLSTRCVTPSVY